LSEPGFKGLKETGLLFNNANVKRGQL